MEPGGYPDGIPGSNSFHFYSQTLTINGNPRLAYVHSGAITDVPRLAALDLSRNALFALESALPARFPASQIRQVIVAPTIQSRSINPPSLSQKIPIQSSKCSPV